MQVSPEITLYADSAQFLGDKRIRLLEMIEVYGSINRAVKDVPMSYKAAWDAIDAMNNMSPQPLVESTGGGTKVTEYGKKIIKLFRTYEDEQKKLMSKISFENGTAEDDIQLVQRMFMKTSARNQFIGVVESIADGQINCGVVLLLKGGDKIYATITHESLTEMEIDVGKEVMALIKSSQIILSISKPIVSARNVILGTISKIHTGEVNSEVVMSLTGGSTITAVVTNDACKELKLYMGLEIYAIFKASSVILAR